VGRYLVLGGSYWTGRLAYLLEVTCQLPQLTLHLCNRLALLDDDLIKVRDRLLQVHQQTLDLGESLVAGLILRRFRHWNIADQR